MTVRLIRPSDTMSKAVITVISGTLDNRRSYGKITVLCVCYKSTDYEKVGIQTLPSDLEPQKILT